MYKLCERINLVSSEAFLNFFYFYRHGYMVQCTIWPTYNLNYQVYVYTTYSCRPNK